MAVKVSEAVLSGLQAVRDSGATNMLDRPRVIELLEQFGHDQAAAWLISNMELYSQGVFQGFEIGYPEREGDLE